MPLGSQLPTCRCNLFFQGRSRWGTLGELPSEGIEAVTRYYREGPNPRTAYECGKELKKKPRFGVDLSDGLQRFRDLLEDADPSRRELAVMALGRIGTADEAPLIERRLQDDAPNVRSHAENVLAAWRER